MACGLAAFPVREGAGGVCGGACCFSNIRLEMTQFWCSHKRAGTIDGISLILCLDPATRDTITPPEDMPRPHRSVAPKVRARSARL